MSRRHRTSRSPESARHRAPGIPASPAAWPFLAAAALALGYGAWAAIGRAWTCDDAFISFRYAENLVRGLGLVYNAGERVEGYSNFLWTLWAAFGMKLGADPERWCIAWGVACYLVTLALLAWNAWRMRRESPGAAPWLPVAALLGAVHLEWNIFATSGLETSLYTLLATLAYVLLVPAGAGARRIAAAGLTLGLAAMTRPDGPLLAGLAGAFLLLAGPHRARSAAALAGGFLVLWIPFTAWRVHYYGDFFPNPYYAKSAALGWYSQGLLYARLYFQKYWVLALGAALAALAAALRGAPGRAGSGKDDRAGSGNWGRRAALAAVLALGYTAFVVRVGGDFMFGRLLVPVAPMFAVLLELAVARLAAGMVLPQLAVTAAAVAALGLTPYPFERGGYVSGIVNEWAFYTPEQGPDSPGRVAGRVLERYFRGLPVRVAFLGSEARLMYYARPAVAIECETGLTDRFIARQHLAERGRIGHEKHAPLDYLLDRRAVNFAFHPSAGRVLQLDRAIPAVGIDLDGVTGHILTWDPVLMDSLRRRGAKFEDLPARIDRILAHLPEMPDPEVRQAYEGLRRMYFQHVSDPRREQPLLRRLGM